jgi:pimeloyl-ACP methyl ester carboxylesterase
MRPVDSRDLRIDADRGRLFAKCWEPDSGRADRGIPIVLFHDSLGCVELWRDFPERLALATGHSVVAYDRLGFGKSDPHPGTLDRDFVRSEVRTGFQMLRKALAIGPFVAFGHSVGGGMAVASAAACAADCRALITESAQAFVEDRTINSILDAKRVFADPSQVDRLKKYHGDKAPWVLHAWIDTWLAADFADWNLDEDLHRLQCPLLVIHGDNDEYGTTRHPERIGAQARGNSTVRIVQTCGHVPHREQRDAVIDMITQWLAGALPA